ncbi:hypothetical protein TVAG_124390 [Trichomonas vaginalis G3]|uniref:SNF7 family protein n=1 Tax=Trichomonas vaginalis (strain ATCC PRA-98 / G3) TaxID=412133 RepID=A2FYR3_TRIV3|nr:charged multivesicular body protein family [Trichomonas vaginalis G3]EAX89959.1 hypothetical protein TVAG_124390 [Trichomonas vaginalis G3]KAI5523682.1 charged multivesicular body protein family [Trichomonas vaginalis G3]|eukprot:XP_001302889.1 hypothetical protein [Trichomonas vaginalis G3]
MQYIKAKELLNETLQLEQYPSMYRQIPDRSCNPKFYDAQIQFWSKFLIDWSKRYNVVSFHATKLEETLMWNDIYPPLAPTLKTLLKSKIIQKSSKFVIKRSLLSSIIASMRCEDPSDYENIEYNFYQNFEQISRTVRDNIMKNVRPSYDLVISDEELIEKFNITSISHLSNVLEKNRYASRLPDGGFLFSSDIITTPPQNQISLFLALKKSIYQMKKKIKSIDDMISTAQDNKYFETARKLQQIKSNAEELLKNGEKANNILQKGFSHETILNQTENSVNSLQKFLISSIDQLMKEVEVESRDPPENFGHQKEENEETQKFENDASDPHPNEAHNVGNDDFDLGFMPTRSVYK